MAHLYTDSLHSDGINFTLFHLLWTKSKTSAKFNDQSMCEELNRLSSNYRKNSGDDHGDNVGNVLPATNYLDSKTEKETVCQIPDTIIFQFGQPVHWYFTSKKNKEAKILRKRKQNLTVEKIEEVFLHKTELKNNGWLDSHDIVAYFIETAECTARRLSEKNICMQSGRQYDSHAKEKYFQRVDKVNNEEGCCNIEYLDAKKLRYFLGQGRTSRSGILQLFIEPSGGGIYNSQIKVIWTNNLFLIERRKTRRELHDRRFGLYERAATFDGPEVFSETLPIRSNVLSTKVRNVCDSLVKHMNYVVCGGKHKKIKKYLHRKEITRMVLHFKMDVNDQLWLLYSSSIRLSKSSQQERIFKGFHKKAWKDIIKEPLNIENLVRLPINIKLNQHSKYNSSLALINHSSPNLCPSCMCDNSSLKFYPVPYKTIICHFEKITSLIKDEKCSGEKLIWPPDPDIIRSGRGVGFGPLLLKTSFTTKNIQGCPSSESHDVYTDSLQREDYVIPPVLRHIHKQLKTDGYRRYRSDPFFLYKECNVCESCFLSYAQLASSSFQMTQPIRLLETSRAVKLKQPSNDILGASIPDKKGGKHMKKIKTSSKKNQTLMKDVGGNARSELPSFPLAITFPVQKSMFDRKISQNAVVAPTSFQQRDDSESEISDFVKVDDKNIKGVEPLRHLVKVYEQLTNTAEKDNPGKKERNPYIIPLLIPEDTSSKTKQMKHNLGRNNIAEKISGNQLKNTTYLSICEEDIKMLTSTLENMTKDENN